MNAFELLRKDHEVVKQIMDGLGRTGGESTAEARERSFLRLEEELTLHAHLEETIFYPALEREARTRDLVFKAFEEHHVVEVLLEELGRLPVDEEQWTAKLRVLIDGVERHIREEEGELLPAAEEVLSEARGNELGAQMEAERQREREAMRAERSPGRRREFSQNREQPSRRVRRSAPTLVAVCPLLRLAPSCRRVFRGSF